ncbi:NmrA family protein-like protein [Macrophomina phaseolina]|uniref:NmrA family protein-like protein n=1 Tax=Macrophomina phaseolina TaxID=35725 RepID=A0ABQ8FX67_9PEZI|nr:NmrA family protein-like protein [Macrophomina phaseolina]
MELTIGIAGIKGKVSLCVAQELLKQPNVLVRGYCRNSSRLPAPLTTNPRVNIIQGRVGDAAAVRPFVKGCDVVVCGYLADNDVMLDGQKLLIDLCEEEGVERRYIASDYTIEFAKLKSGQFQKKDPILQIKEYLDTEKVKAVHVLNGIFMETLVSDLTYIREPTETKLRYCGTGDEAWEMTTYKTTGQYVAHGALDREAVGFFRFLGARKSTRQIAAEFKSVYGIEPAVERIGSLDDLYNKAHTNGEQNYILAYMNLILRGQVYLEGEFDNAKYPSVKPMTLTAFFKSHSVSELHQALDKVGQDWD